MPDFQNSFSYNWFEQVWNNSQEEAIDALVAENATIAGLNDELRGPEGFRNFYQSFRNDFDQVHVTVTDVINYEDGEEAFCNVTALHRASGRQVNFDGSCRVMIVDGQITEAYNNFDFATMNQQLANEIVTVNQH